MSKGKWKNKYRRDPVKRPDDWDYDFRLNNALDNGSEEIGVGWDSTGTIFTDDTSSNNTGLDDEDHVGGYSFPNVNLTTCSQAYLSMQGNTVLVPGRFIIRGQSQASGASARWVTANRPIGNSAVAVTGSLTGLTMAKGALSYNVTTIVSNILSTAGSAALTAFGAGTGRINFWTEFEDGSGIGGGFSVNTMTARLQIRR